MLSLPIEVVRAIAPDMSPSAGDTSAKRAGWPEPSIAKEREVMKKTALRIAQSGIVVGRGVCIAFIVDGVAILLFKMKRLVTYSGCRGRAYFRRPVPI